METRQVEEIVTGTAVILDETNYPPEITLFHTNDEYDDDGNITQPAGWKLPGGRYEKPRDKTPRHAARNETRLEVGLKVRLAKFFRGSEFGEAFFESKRKITDKKIFWLKVYTFLMKKVGNNVIKRFETDEGGASGSFSLKDVLLMPLARNTETEEYHSYGIHFSARQRIITTLHRAGYDFQKLIPDLSKFWNDLDPEEFGGKVYWILENALLEEQECADEEESTPPPAPDELVKHDKDCDCDACWRRFAKTLK